MNSPIRTIFKYGFIIGLISFLVGFVGPILVTPEANQGPLLGIFITGPAGFVFGLVVGGIVALINQKKQKQSD